MLPVEVPEGFQENFYDNPEACMGQTTYEQLGNVTLVIFNYYFYFHNEDGESVFA